MKKRHSYFANGQEVGEHVHCLVSSILVCCAFGTLMLVSTLAFAETKHDEGSYEIDIPRLNAAAALNSLAEQTGAIILFPYDLAESRSAKEVIGRYTLMEALELLLQESGLSSGLSDKQVILISLDDETEHHEKKGDEEEMNSQLGKTIGTLIASIFAVSGAAGQDDAAPESNQFDEIIVTAQKREQSMQEVPMAIEVLSGEYIELTGFVDFEDYARSLTNIAFGPTQGGLNIIMRGIAPLTGVPTVAFYLDDVPVTGQDRAGGVDQRLFDIERVEVLKGPQGHLYGSSAMGGVIKVVTRPPVLNDYETRINGSLSTTRYGGENFLGNAALNFPLVEDVAALRLVVSFGSEDGYIERVSRFSEGDRISLVPPFNDLTDIDANVTALQNRNSNRADTLAIRASLLFRVNDWLELTPSIQYQSKKFGGLNAISEEIFGFEGVPRISAYHAEAVESKYDLVSLKATAKLGFGTITSVTSFFDFDGSAVDDLTPFAGFLTGAAPTPEDVAFFPPFLNDATREEFHQEIRFTSEWDSPIALSTGVYFRDTNKTRKQDLVGPEGASTHFGIPTDIFFLSDASTDDREFALFANVSYQLAAFELQLGARYFEFDFSSDILTDGIFNGGVSTFSGGATEDGVSLFGSMSYDFSEHLVVYVRAAEGYREGQLQAAPPVSVCGGDGSANVVNSDSVWNYEIGAKTNWGGRLILNAAAFRIDYTDVQQAIDLPCGFAIFENAGSATSEGVEVDASVALLPGLILSGGVGYVESTLDTDSPVVGGDAGESLLGVPKWTANAALIYNADWGNPYLDPYFRVDWSYVDDKTNDFGALGGSPVGNLDTEAYEIVNFRVGAVFSNDWQASVYINNALDERANQGIGTFGIRKTYINRPRTIGLNLSRDF